MKTIKDAVHDLERAARTLDPAQGRIARRNARRRVLSALSAVRERLDAEYPAIKLPPKPSKRRTLRERRKELIDEGWVVTVDAQLLGFVAKHRLPTRTTPDGWIKEPLKAQVSVSAWQVANSAGNMNGVKAPAETWVPGWVAHYYVTAPERQRVVVLDQARHNPKMIQAAKAAIRLGSLDEAVRSRLISMPKQ